KAAQERRLDPAVGGEQCRRFVDVAGFKGLQILTHSSLHMPLPSCDARAASLTIRVRQGKGRSGVVGNPVCYGALRLPRVQPWEPSMSETNASDGLWLGVDTAGTFTDAVLLAGGRRVIA